MMHARRAVSQAFSIWFLIAVEKFAARAVRVISVTEKIVRREISGFRLCVVEAFALLGCCTA